MTKLPQKVERLERISKAIIKMFKRNIAEKSRKIIEIPTAHHHELCSISKLSLTRYFAQNY